MLHVYVIILNYKKWMEVEECLETLLRSQYDNFTVVVIDNDSQNNSLEELIAWTKYSTNFSKRVSPFQKDLLVKPVRYNYYRSNKLNEEIQLSEFSRLVFIQNEKNKGFAGGINTILKYLLNEDAYVWLLNPDMIVEEATLKELVSCAINSEPRSIIGSVIKHYDNPGKVHFFGGGRINFNSATVELAKRERDIPKLDYISGGSFFTHARHFKEIGLLPEDYFLYWEETDFCYHAKKQDYKLVVCESAVCYDKVSTSIGKSFLSDYYYTRNGLLFLSKYKKGKVAVAVFFTIFRLLKRILSGKFDRAKGMYKGMVSFLKRGNHENK
jgi:GT2 family glycosyltransferase